MTTKIVKIRIILRAPTPIQEAAGKELWRRLSGNNQQPTGGTKSAD